MAADPLRDVKFWQENSKSIQGFLLDISGVLLDGVTTISGSVDAVKKLRSANIPLRFLTNETQLNHENIVKKLQQLGFGATNDEVFAPAPATRKILKERGLRPHLLVHPDCASTFDDIDQRDPNCVVLGDAADNFSYKNLNDAFQVLIKQENPVLFSMGRGKYYKEEDRLHLDVGAFMKAFEYACDIEAEVVGKPSSTYFNQAVNDLNLTAPSVVMIGDDIVNDVGGAQSCGLFGVQVRTGKYRPADEPHPTVKPDSYVDNLAQGVEFYFKYKN